MIDDCCLTSTETYLRFIGQIKRLQTINYVGENMALGWNARMPNENEDMIESVGTLVL